MSWELCARGSLGELKRLYQELEALWMERQPGKLALEDAEEVYCGPGAEVLHECPESD